MRIIKKDQINIDEIISTLKKGGLVIMPTETLYGAFVDATNTKAVKKLNDYKKRPFGKPYSVAVVNQKMAEEYADLNENAKSLYKSFMPGPLTVVSKGKHKVAQGVESEKGTLGIRIPDYQLVLDVIKVLGKPITATSANASYQKRPYKVKDILQNISLKQKGLIDLIIDAGELPHKEPSTVIDTTLDDPIVLRQGDIKIKDKNEVLSRSEEDTQNLAKELYQKYEKHLGQRAIIFALEGPMGAGKTIFTKGLAKTMGINEEIVSPTYDLILNYKSGNRKNELVHIDVWRILTQGEFEDLGVNKMITGKSILAIEWAEKVSDIIRKYNDEAVVVWVKIGYPTNGKENERLMSWGVI
ncbi:MAG TPA: L-threonylcarbamoyladenylate synthase [Patescibacteria group bacterium]|nr:L-threonylcarbamoyladenylate synthase [Patescibacteria group bacterium]